MNVVVVGGGAAGLTAAIIASRYGAEVRVLEAMSKPASKILMTGGGRCNYTNYNLESSCYSNNSDFIDKIIYKYDASDAMSFFESIGVYPIIRNGYVYPRTEEAKTVADALVNECNNLGVRIHNNTKVTNIAKTSESFKVFVEGYEYDADKVIVATGGLTRAEECATYGYKMASELGHEVNATIPALTGLVCDVLPKASGVRVRAKIELDDYSEVGEVQITNFGISGIPVLNISKQVASRLNQKELVDISIDFLPEISCDEYEQMIQNDVQLKSLLPEKLSNVIGDNNPKEYIAKIIDAKGFDYAQVTAGGVSTIDINSETMESAIVPGLYFAGELIDVDGRCGGYNLHFAWASGTIAGAQAAGATYEHIMPSFDQLRRWESAEIGSRRE